MNKDERRKNQTRENERSDEKKRNKKIREDKGRQENMFSNTLPKRRSIKKPRLTKNKFANLTKDDWKETNEQSKKDRGISGLTYRDIYGR
ncbi:hypothetical protein MOB72_08570 [Bacillus licheniformis]|uniref:hypothetical protein n=1 Tax=Bacillus licheniformis TaxID=1402 RepID=UPI00119FFB15|nr:hypothetical protein [Bacillus licheniformis]MCA1183623.1 hypothetical protein [Bacillus licheniformis]MCM3209214.1 hypothetical protein [Bacillus licheniformis]MCM3284822.1 hypothetical protein [Bacillus licheniformis]MCY7743761.1 hypothetical protein [Bacillus licheniformis]MCY7954805.1 hypothetical protein [Bacillus licheniformis]